MERIASSVLEEVVVSDTIPLSAAARATGKFKVLSVDRLLGEAIKRMPNGVMHELKKLYLDVASMTGARSFQGVRDLVGIERMLFGTDFPFGPIGPIVQNLERLGVKFETADGGVMRRASAKANFSYNSREIALRDMRLALDDSKLTGRVGLEGRPADETERHHGRHQSIG